MLYKGFTLLKYLVEAFIILEASTSLAILSKPTGSEGSKLDEAIEVVEELQNLLKGAKNTAGQQTAVEGKTKQ